MQMQAATFSRFQSRCQRFPAPVPHRHQLSPAALPSGTFCSETRAAGDGPRTRQALGDCLRIYMRWARPDPDTYLQALWQQLYCIRQTRACLLQEHPNHRCPTAFRSSGMLQEPVVGEGLPLGTRAGPVTWSGVFPSRQLLGLSLDDGDSKRASPGPCITARGPAALCSHLLRSCRVKHTSAASQTSAALWALKDKAISNTKVVLGWCHAWQWH